MSLLGQGARTAKQRRPLGRLRQQGRKGGLSSPAAMYPHELLNRMAIPASPIPGHFCLNAPVPPRQLYSDHPTPAPALDLQHRSARFPRGLADAADESGRKGSNVYDSEISQWLWQFGRGKQHLGVAETEERRIAVAKDGAKRAVTTQARRHSKALKAAGAPG